MFRPSKQLQAWTLLVQDGSFDSLSGAEKIEEAISAELRAAWISGDLIPNGSEVRVKPADPTDMEILRKEWAGKHPVEISPEDCKSCSTVTDVQNAPNSIRLTVMPPVTIESEQAPADVPRAPIDRMETISPELAELAQTAQKTRVPILTPAPEIKTVKAETPGLIAEGKPIPPFYRGASLLVNTKLIRERMKALAHREGTSRNQLMVSKMKFKPGGALGKILSAKHDTIETCFAQYLAEVLGQDILIP